MRYDDALAKFQQRGTNLRCNDAIATLEALGFEVVQRKKSGHYTITHDALPEFQGAGFSGGHGSNNQLLPAYVRTIKKILVSYEVELKEFLGEN